MRKLLFLSALLFFFNSLFAQNDFKFYRKTTAMIPMRDGKKLYTVIMIPDGMKGPLPVLIQRTPYGASFTNVQEDKMVDLTLISGFGDMAKRDIFSCSRISAVNIKVRAICKFTSR